jgi:hypothetical protein
MENIVPIKTEKIIGVLLNAGDGRYGDRDL